MFLTRILPVALLSLVGVVSLRPVSAQSCAAQAPGLVGWWSGDGTTSDLIGSNDGVLQGGATYAPGKVSQAFSLPPNPNGPTAYVSVADAPALNPTTMTVEAWIYRTAANAEYDPVVKKNGSVDDAGFAFEFSGPYIAFYVDVQGGSWAGGAMSNQEVPLNQWVHVVGTYDGNATRVYVDGSLAGTSSAPGAIKTADGPLNIGHDPVNTDRYFTGLIDEVKLYNRALSDAEVLSIYNAGSAGTCKKPRVCLLYDQTKAVNSGATYPIKLQLCDAAGNNLSSSATTLHATSVTAVSSSISGAVQDAGSANPDNDFRYLGTIGTTGGYMFNLSTVGLSRGTYNLNFTSGGSDVYSCPFQVK